MAEALVVADVVIDSRSAGAEAVYTYRANPGTRPGDAHFVPLGPRQELGFVAEVRSVEPDALGFPVERLKGLGTRVEGLDLPEELVETVRFAAREYLCPLPVAIAAAIPPGARSRVATAWRLATGGAEHVPISPAQSEILRAMAEAGGTIEDTEQKPLPTGSKRALRLLEAKGRVARALRLSLPAERHRLTGLLRVTADEDALEQFLRQEAKRKPAQAYCLLQMQESAGAAFSVQEIKALAGVTDQTIRALRATGLLEAAEQRRESEIPPEPSPAQAHAIASILESVASRIGGEYLVYGVTGSGKTEVYLRAAAEVLKAGRRVLYLVPEIALTAQVIAQLRSRFGSAVAVLHSNLAAGERMEAWMRAQTGEAALVLGARSALFAPVRNLGLIVVDEEHEPSYKQESGLRYHAKTVARELARRHGATLVLGSATPSVETFYEAATGRLERLDLPERAARAAMPTVHIVDLSDGYRTGRPSIFGLDLRERLAETLERGEQAILFLNRRAYAPSLTCRDCGHRFVCPRCSVALAFHQREGRIRCHHCDFGMRPPEVCPGCGGLRVAPLGLGAEKVEEATRQEFPEARVARLDRDTARRRGAVEETLALFRSGEVQVLVGTQMVAKGLDFPNVTLVGVILADTSLNVPDFRASERTYQLLSQVAGRAGRSARPGEVVIQTFNPRHLAIEKASEHDYEGFYEAALAERAQAGYPPFRRLVNLVLSGESRPDVVRAAEDLHDRLAEVLLATQVLGPADCPLARLSGRWRRHLLVKLGPDAGLEPIEDAIAYAPPGGVAMTVDVDPQSLV